MENNLANNIEKNLENSNELEKNQNNFLSNMLKDAINTAVDIGIRAILPDFIEEQVIDIKDNIFNNGFKEGLKKTVDDAIGMGKSALNFIKGDLKSIDDMQNVVKEGGIIDGISNLWDFAVNKGKEKGIIKSNVAKILKTGKNTVLNNVEKNIQGAFKKELNKEEDLDKNIKEWKEAYNKQDFDKMEEQYKKIEKGIKKLIPIEKTLASAREVENLHNLIKNNGKNFNISSEQLELAQKL